MSSEEFSHWMAFYRIEMSETSKRQRQQRGLAVARQRARKMGSERQVETY
jgi:hypothetical protein